MRSPRDSGQIGALVVAVADSARAQSVADAVALAVAAGRSDVVDRLIDGLGAIVVNVAGESDEADVVTVRVALGGREAVARAASTP